MSKMRVAILLPLAVALVMMTAWRGGEKDRGGRDQAGNGGKGIMDPKAIGVLKTVSDYLGRAKGYSFEGWAIVDDVGKSGIITKHFNEGEITLVHPDKFVAIAHRDDGKTRRFSFDGKTLAYVLVEENSFVSGRIRPRGFLRVAQRFEGTPGTMNPDRRPASSFKPLAPPPTSIGAGLASVHARYDAFGPASSTARIWVRRLAVVNGFCK